MSNKIAKTIARQKEKIAEGNYYEAHQQLRVITARYLKSSDYSSAADILSNGSLLLLRAGQGGSGGDLAITLLTDVYIKAPWPIDAPNKARILEVLRAFPAGEPTRKRFIQELNNWTTSPSVTGSDPERGDPEVHHAIGIILADEGEAYDAERNLLLGQTPQSAQPLATLHYNWYKTDSPHTAGLYASRSVLPYLVLGNLQSATIAFATFTSQLLSSSSVPTQTIESSKSSVRVFPSLPLLNFLSLLLLAVQKSDKALFQQLAKHYAAHLKDLDELWSDALAQIGEIWFGIKVPRQSGSNPLFDMMSSMMFGGGGQKPAAAGAPGRSSTPKPQQAQIKEREKPPVAMDLD